MDPLVTEQLERAGLSEYFQQLPPSHQKEYLNWINSAKKPETKAKRVDQMIEMLSKKSSPA